LAYWFGGSSRCRGQPVGIIARCYLTAGTSQPKVSPRTYERYCEIVRKNIIPTLGAIHLTKLRPSQIAGRYNNALASGRRDGKGGLAPTTVIYMHRLIKQSLGQAVRWELLTRNPADAVDPQRPSVRR
jgi:hypothetical protein